MARTALTVQTVVDSGLEVTYTNGDATNEHEFVNNGDTFIHIVNGGGGDVVATIVTPATVQGLTVEDPAITVTAGEERFIGPFPGAIFNQSDGKVHLDLDVDTSVTLAALSLR